MRIFFGKKNIFHTLGNNFSFVTLGNWEYFAIYWEIDIYFALSEMRRFGWSLQRIATIPLPHKEKNTSFKWQMNKLKHLEIKIVHWSLDRIAPYWRKKICILQNGKWEDLIGHWTQLPHRCHIENCQIIATLLPKIEHTWAALYMSSSSWLWGY